ncbi:MAG: GNAT family N-acetyltransferase [Yoonia sp.]|uniref:GNAT family N-acetyltransferase n=1 Tax=Yoonia sp. TaxID=2212373 RepID=UPI003EF7DADB
MALRTERLILRAPQQSDLEDLYAIYSDPRVMTYWSTPPHESLDITKEHLDRMIASIADPLTYFVVEMDGCAIGNAGMYKGDEVGFLLRADYWRRGIMTEAMRAIIPYLFKVSDHAQLTADADPLNTASVELLKSLGFHETGRAKNTFCINGVWSDSVYLTLLRPET